MEITKETLAEVIEKKTREHWEDKQTPYLLADVVPDIVKEGFDYKALISPLSLKQFTAGMGGKVKVIQHSYLKAKVGLIPADKDFSFDQQPVVSPKQAAKDEIVARGNFRSNKYVVLNFLQALSALSDEDLEKVVIPASVLAKLLKEK